MEITQSHIAGDVRKLGLREGHSLVVHSSLSSLGRVRGGADTVIDAILECIGPEGTLLMPVMTFEGDFDHARSPSKTGLITETFRRRDGVIRSMNATHSIAGFGPDAARLLAGHGDDLPHGPNGPDAPLGRLAGEGGLVLLLGVTHVSNTTLHIVHYLAGLPMREEFRRVRVRGGDGRTYVTRARHPGCSSGFHKLDPLFTESGIQRIGNVGNAESRLMKGQDIIEAGIEAVGTDPHLVLCDSPECRFCTYAGTHITDASP